MTSRHVALLLHCKGDCEVVDHDGNSALILAASHGHAAVVATLINSGCNINHSNAAGLTAYLIAGILVSKDTVL